MISGERREGEAAAEGGSGGRIGLFSALMNNTLCYIIAPGSSGRCVDGAGWCSEAG